MIKSRLMRKTIIIVLGVLFFINSTAMAADKLAPETSSRNGHSKTMQQVNLICEMIEKGLNHSGNEVDITGLKKWIDEQGPDTFKEINLYDQGGEYHIVVNNQIIIRYFDPGAKGVFDSFNGATQKLSGFDKDIGSMKRQVYRIIPLFQPHKTVEEAFRHVFRKEGLVDDFEFVVDDFYVPVGALAGAQIDVGKKRVSIHPEFAMNYYDMKRSKVGFAYTFEDGVTRWIDVADTLAYAAAFHESNHVQINADGTMSINRDVNTINIIGRRYAVPLNAVKLWFYFAYLAADGARYRNAGLKSQIDWMLHSKDDKDAVGLVEEFIPIVNDPKKWAEVERLALMINKAFFQDRKKAGIETTPARLRGIRKVDQEIDKIPPEGRKHFPGGPGMPGYIENGDIISEANRIVLDINANTMKTMASEIKEPILYRIPIETLWAIGKENATLFLMALQKSPNIVVELFSVTPVAEDINKAYKYYGIEKREFTGTRTRLNTVTFFVTGKDEPVTAIDVMEKMGDGMALKPMDTILLPIGQTEKGTDLAGLVRSTVLSARLILIANGKYDRAFLEDTLEQFRTICECSQIDMEKDFDLTVDDILHLAAPDNINDLMRSLKKIVKLLPIVPIDPEILRYLYLHAAKVLASA